jgi:hypothetical protein
VRYIKEKYEISESMKLSAWFDGSHVLFCRGDAGKDICFHAGFNKVLEPVRFRYDNSVRIVGNRFIISSSLSEQLDRRLAFIELENGFAFVNDKNGTLYAADRNEFGTRAIRSTGLVRYVQQKLGGDILFGVAFCGGVAFSRDRYLKPADINLKKGRLLLRSVLVTAT